MNDDFYCKRTYYFVNDDRSMLSSALLDAEYTIIKQYISLDLRAGIEPGHR